MLNKLRLDQTKIYEKHIALEEISNMLVNFVEGTSHHLSIGAEQGNIDKWDDFVIEKSDGGNIYIQAKRQLTDFSSDPVIRDTYNAKDGTIKLRKLSPLDASLESLANWINDADFSSPDLKNEFRLELPDGSPEIKEGLEIRHFRTLLENHYRSITTVKDLESLASIDNSVLNSYNWLTHWCGFSGWDHILKLMKVLKIRTSGRETDIISRVENILSRIFKPEDIKKVYSLILSYIDENETFAGAIRPRQLLYQLKEYLRPEIVRWTSFQNDGLIWCISGINDLEDNTEIERPPAVVSALWTEGNPTLRRLKIQGDCIENCLISLSLMRLSMHPQSSFDIICSDRRGWVNAIKNKTGGTLGTTKNDLDDLRILDSLDPVNQSEKKELSKVDEQERFANELHKEMFNCNFARIKTRIIDLIREMASGDLRTETENRWREWSPLLEDNIDEQKKLFTQILLPKAEGTSILGELRVGPKTADLLAESLFLLLIVSVCLSDGNNTGWKVVNNRLEMNAIGLAWWSGPAEGLKKLIEIDDEEGIGKLMEKEPGNILILPQSKLSGAHAFNEYIFGGLAKERLLSHPQCPKLLITKDQEFKRKLKNGSISELRGYFEKRLDEYENSIHFEAERIAEGVRI